MTNELNPPFPLSWTGDPLHRESSAASPTAAAGTIASAPPYGWLSHLEDPYMLWVRPNSLIFPLPLLHLTPDSLLHHIVNTVPYKVFLMLCFFYVIEAREASLKVVIGPDNHQ